MVTPDAIKNVSFRPEGTPKLMERHKRLWWFTKYNTNVRKELSRGPVKHKAKLFCAARKLYEKPPTLTPQFFERTVGFLHNLYYVLVGWPVTGFCAEGVAKGGCSVFFHPRSIDLKGLTNAARHTSYSLLLPPIRKSEASACSTSFSFSVKSSKDLKVCKFV